jgi:ABC-type multidrug transport system ATPase subunit
MWGLDMVTEKENLIIEELVVTYDNEINVLENFTFEFEKNNIYLLLGDNGQGKTTLIKAITGEITTTSGNISYRNKPLIENISVQTQNFESFDKLKVKEVIDLCKKIFKKPKNYEELEEIFEIKNLKNQFMKNLSGGQKKAISIYLTFLNDKDIIILDEPISGVDLKKKKKFNKFLGKMKNENKIIIMISHELGGYREIVDKILMIHDKKIRKEYDINDYEIAIIDYMERKER